MELELEMPTALNAPLPSHAERGYRDRWLSSSMKIPEKKHKSTRDTLVNVTLVTVTSWSFFFAVSRC